MLSCSLDTHTHRTVLGKSKFSRHYFLSTRTHCICSFFFKKSTPNLFLSQDAFWLTAIIIFGANRVCGESLWFVPKSYRSESWGKTVMPSFRRWICTLWLKELLQKVKEDQNIKSFCSNYKDIYFFSKLDFIAIIILLLKVQCWRYWILNEFVLSNAEKIPHCFKKQSEFITGHSTLKQFLWEDKLLKISALTVFFLKVNMLSMF